MTLIHSSQTLNETDPQTHALIIGVSHYAHLRGGKSWATAPCAENLSLTQLTSPVISAMNFADWLTAKFHNSLKPLGTVDVLLSPQPNQPVSDRYAAVDRAIFSNIQTVFADWIVRCERNRDNIGIFYFCGHGLEKGEHILLPEDFGANPNNAWATSIGFTTTHQAMGVCHFETQLSLIDACRELPLNLALNPTVSPQPLLTMGNKRLYDRDAPILKATTPQGAAQAQADKVSYFTQAVNAGLDGLGAERQGGLGWVVSTSSLKRAVQLHMERFAPGRCDTGGGVSQFTRDLHEFSGPARVFAEVRCDPAAAHNLAKLALMVDNQLKYKRAMPERSPWRLEVESGPWVAHAEFNPGSDYRDTESIPQYAYPPLFTPSLMAATV